MRLQCPFWLNLHFNFYPTGGFRQLIPSCNARSGSTCISTDKCYQFNRSRRVAMHVLAQHALRQQFVKISEVDNFTCLLGSGSTCIATCVIYTPQPAGTACLLGSGSTCIATGGSSKDQNDPCCCNASSGSTCIATKRSK